MFDRIARRYDLLNRLLSFGQDVVWRNRVAKHLPAHTGQYILDLATGTADLLISLVNKNQQVKSGVGIDMAEKMLQIGQEKLKNRHIQEKVSLQTGDALNIPYPEQTFDAVTIAFGIRNLTDVNLALREMHKVLKNNGRAIILEFSLPSNPLIRKIYLFYFRHILPRIGGLISGDQQAYNYLNNTVEAFPYGKEFCDMLSSAGFEEVRMTPLTFGIATIYQGDKTT